MTHKINFNFT